MARSPWVNHGWRATFYFTPGGLTTSLIPDGDGGIEVQFDFVNHTVLGHCGSGKTESFPLSPMSVADSHSHLIGMIKVLGGVATFHGSRNELEDPMPFAEDMASRPYDSDAVT